MRSTSNARKAFSVLLSATLLFQGSGASIARALDPPEPCVLLRLSAPEISLDEARDRLDALPGLLAERLRVRWVPHWPAAPPAAGESFPEADAGALDEISRTIAAASRLMEGMETREASELLADAERSARRYRFGDATRLHLAEIFFRRGIVFLWEGDEEKGREMFARSRALRPEFFPEPALYSPAVRAAWALAASRPAPPAELLVQSLPPGAHIEVDGAKAGATPGRVQVRAGGPVRMRLALEGYRAEERVGQWLPGDSGLLEVTLARDPAADLPEVLPREPEGAATARILGEIAERSGASRVAVLILGGHEGRRSLRVVSMGRGDRAAALLGETPWPEREGAAGEVAGKAAWMLSAAGWPARMEDPRAPWYRSWWAWTLLGAAVAGIAAAALSGGGDSASSTGTIGVGF
jgi:hypothetical protein